VLRHFATGDHDANPMRLLNRHICRRAIPVLLEVLRKKRRTMSEIEIQAALQMVGGTLAVTLLSDPGPLHLDEDRLELTLRTMVCRYLQLSAT
jgi:hypothetical protein